MSELGMTQAELVRRSGLSSAYVSNLVTGQRGKRVSVETVHRLAKALKVRPSALVDTGSHMRLARARKARS